MNLYLGELKSGNYTIHWAPFIIINFFILSKCNKWLNIEITYLILYSEDPGPIHRSTMSSEGMNL